MTLRPRTLITALLTLSGTLLLCVGIFWMQLFLSTAIAPGEKTGIVISSGSSFSKVAKQLQEAGVISDARRFTLLARWKDQTGQIHAGEYLFEGPARPGAILTRLVAGDIRQYQVTIPEGFNQREIAARLAKLGIGSQEEILSLCNDEVFLEELGISATSLEGYLFPETYTYTASTTARQQLTAMVTQLQEKIPQELLNQAATLNLDRHRLITLASIIQKEAGNVLEMPLISAVFHNRLRIGIPLQADPTVIYGIEDFDGNLTRKHLNTATPYNTYKMKGLPPGPIASPGQFALHAAANPADSKALYFVSRGDGTHEFSNTLVEHNRAVQRYQLHRRSRQK